MRKRSKLNAVLNHIGFAKEIENLKIYYALRKIIINKYRISIRHLEKSRDYKAVEARMIFFALLKKYTSYNYRTISKLFNIKNHSIVYHAIKLIQYYLRKNICRDTILKKYKEVENIFAN